MNLTQTALWTKRAVVLVSITLVLILGSRIIFEVWYRYQLTNKASVQDRPDEKFGVLPKLDFPPDPVSSSNYSYALDTQTGDFPTLPTQLKVYFIPQAGISLLAPERAKQLASQLGFNNGPQILSETRYKFDDGIKGAILIDLPTGNFHFQKGESSESATLKPGFINSSDQLINDFREYLGGNKLVPDDIRSGRFGITFDAIENNKAKTATISATPADFNTLPVVTSGQYGLIRAFVNNNPDNQKRYLQLDYTHWIIDESSFSSYALKAPKEALQDLQSGNGHVVIEPLKPQVSISDVYMGYYESEVYSPYLQPVYVFEGPHFRALVQAVKKTQ